MALKKVIWAIDATMGEKQLQTHTGDAIRAITKGMKCVVQPVAVIGPPNPYLTRTGLLDILEDAKAEVKANLDDWLKRRKLSNVAKPALLTQTSFSTKAGVKVLTDYAKKARADLIVVSTHARKGMERVMLGSFAETLLLQSSIPVYVINPKARVDRSIKTILFPSDFTAKSQKTFHRVLKLAKRLKATVIIYHQLELYADYIEPSVSGSPLYQKYLDMAKTTSEDAGEKLRKIAEKAGVKAKVVIDNRKGYAPDAILSVEKKMKPSMIAMASETGPVASLLLGSVTRRVLREARCPIWVIHPK